MSHGTLRTLAVNFALMSLFAIGGGNSAVPEMQRLVVEVHHWMTDRQFTDLFALAQVTPGPNMIIVTLIGYQVAGVLGALVSTAAMCGPTCVLAFCIGGVWDRFKEAPWRLQSRLACYRFQSASWERAGSSLLWGPPAILRSGCSSLRRRSCPMLRGSIPPGCLGRLL